MSKGKRFLALLMSLLLCFPSGCNFSENDSLRAIMILKSSDKNFEYWQTVKMGAQEAAKDLAVDLSVIGPFREDAVDVQVEMLYDAIDENPDIICLAATDATRLIEPCREAKEAGITVVLVDSGLNEDLDLSFVGTDNAKASYDLGEEIANTVIGAKKKILILSHDRNTQTAQIRVNSFLEGLESDGKKDIVGPYYCGDSLEYARQRTLDALDEYPDLSVIYTTYQIIAEGAAQAVTEYKKEHIDSNRRIFLYTFDYSAKVNEYMEEGIVTEIIAQKPFNMGYITVERAVSERQKKAEAPEFIDTGCIRVNFANMYDQEIQQLIFPFIS